MTLPRYRRYKACPVDWVPEIPESWECRRLSRSFTQVGSGTTPRSDNPAYYENGKINWLNTGDLNDRELLTSEKKITELALSDHSTLKIYPPGSVVIAMYGATIGKVGLLRFPATVNQACCVFSQSTHFTAEFLFYWFLAARESIVSLAIGAGQPNISQEILRALRLPCPSLSEQKTIASFLNIETAKLDALMDEQQRLIDLLKEKRQALISHAVTKGINPAVSMVPSGVMWIGEIPEHWKISQSRRMFAVRSEPALATDQMLTASQKYGVLYQTDFVEIEGRRVVEVIMGIESLKHVEPDDFIISMRSFQGGIEWCRLRGSTSFHYVMVKPISGVYPPFFAHLFKSQVYIQALRATTDLIRDGQELRFSNFVQVDLPVVPIEEQCRISAFLDHETKKLDTLTTEAQRAIQLLQERRTALISAAVTGQIDVRKHCEEIAA